MNELTLCRRINGGQQKSPQTKRAMYVWIGIWNLGYEREVGIGVIHDAKLVQVISRLVRKDTRGGALVWKDIIAPGIVAFYHLLAPIERRQRPRDIIEAGNWCGGTAQHANAGKRHIADEGDRRGHGHA